MNIDLKFVELAADVFIIVLYNTRVRNERLESRVSEKGRPLKKALDGKRSRQQPDLETLTCFT